MTKEKHRSYWKTLVDEERQIGLPASIFRHYRKIKSPGHRLAIWPFLWPQPPISRGLHSLIFENADGSKGHRIARGNRVESIIKRARKNKAISLRIAEYDLEKLKEKAQNDGIPYQTLISMVLHKYKLVQPSVWFVGNSDPDTVGAVTLVGSGTSSLTATIDMDQDTQTIGFYYDLLSVMPPYIQKVA